MQEREQLKQFQSEYSLLNPLEYVQLLRDSTKTAKKRIWLQTMNLEADHLVGLLFNDLASAAKRGLDVRLNVDGFNEMVTDGHINFIPSNKREENDFRSFRRNQKNQLLESLKNQGVTIAKLNWPGGKINTVFPPHGRNHIKIALTDNKAYLGGVNISDKDLQREDGMIEISQPKVVSEIEKVFIASANQTLLQLPDLIAQTKDTRLLIDTAVKESIILKNLELIFQQARDSIFLTSQFYPDNILLNHLQKAAKRGVKITIIVSSPAKITEGIAWAFDTLNRLSSVKRGLNILEYPNWLHTKLAIIDADQKNPLVIYGSHNFSYKGAEWKNQEIALVSSNPQLIRNFTIYAHSLLQKIDGKF